MKKLLNNRTLTLITCLVLAVPTVAQEKSKSKSGGPGRADRLLLTITATVEAVDHANREVTLKGPLGNLETFVVDDVVKRFNEVKVGDAVTVDYYIGVAAEVRKPTPEEEKEPLVILEGAGKKGAKSPPQQAACAASKP